MNFAGKAEEIGGDVRGFLADSNKLYHCWIWEWDPIKQKLSIGEDLKSALGLSNEALPSSLMAFNAFVHPGDRNFASRNRLAPLAHWPHGALAYDLRLTTSTGKNIWCREILEILPNSPESVLIRGVVQDISSERHRMEMLTSMAMADPLTGLGNRRAWDQLLTSWIEITRRKKRAASIALLDIDHFKGINDSFGHGYGDMVLVLAAEVMQGEVRASDTVCRIGGDEFAIMFPETDEQDAAIVSNRIRDAMARRFSTSSGLPHVTLSMGVAQVNELDFIPGDVIERADRALYASKQAGRDRVTMARQSA